MTIDTEMSLLKWLLIACVVIIFGASVLIARENMKDSRVCRAKGGIPVLMRNGIICLPPGTAIPLD